MAHFLVVLRSVITRQIRDRPFEVHFKNLSFEISVSPPSPPSSTTNNSTNGALPRCPTTSLRSEITRQIRDRPFEVHFQESPLRLVSPPLTGPYSNLRTLPHCHYHFILIATAQPFETIPPNLKHDFVSSLCSDPFTCPNPLYTYYVSSLQNLPRASGVQKGLPLMPIKKGRHNDT